MEIIFTHGTYSISTLFANFHGVNPSYHIYIVEEVYDDHEYLPLVHNNRYDYTG